MKRIFDILVSSCLLAGLAPLMGMVALAIRLEDRGAVLFRQTRVGLNGRRFGLLKFRSMVQNAESIGPQATAKGDARITKVGRIIRRTSIDELPQLINVLRGEMSIVGPRPDVPAQQTDYTVEQWQLRISVKPGITGLAQATMRSTATHEQRTNLDLQYVKTMSLALDVVVIFKTIGKIVSRASN